MKIIQPKKEDGMEYWERFREGHPSIRLKDVFIVYTWHGENVITKEFAAYDEVNRQFGDEWDDARKNNGARTKREQTWFRTKYRFVELHPVGTEDDLKGIIKRRYNREDIVSFTDLEEWEGRLKEDGYDRVFIEWVTRSW